MFAFAAVEPIARTYNLILEAAAERDDLEALVLVHPAHRDRRSRVLREGPRGSARPRVAVVGCAGAAGVRRIAWWEGDVVGGERRRTLTRSTAAAIVPRTRGLHAPAATAEVEAVDGQLLVLSPWAVRNVRFDETLILGHGFELDFCLQVREPRASAWWWGTCTLRPSPLARAGRRPRRVDRGAHPDCGEVGRCAERRRRRRGRLEAPRAAGRGRPRGARAIAFSTSLKLDARVLELERELEEKTSSLSWRLTEPLRALNRWRRER